MQATPSSEREAIRWQVRADRWLPSPRGRRKARQRIHQYPRERFTSEEDFFFFVHIHPANRWLHAFGMCLGFAFFMAAFVNLLQPSWLCVVYLCVGQAFFVGGGLLGHLLYDGVLYLRAEPRSLWVSFPWVLRLNMYTLTGRFDAHLSDFVKSYPWAVEAWDLVEKT